MLYNGETQTDNLSTCVVKVEVMNESLSLDYVKRGFEKNYFTLYDDLNTFGEIYFIPEGEIIEIALVVPSGLESHKFLLFSDCYHRPSQTTDR